MSKQPTKRRMIDDPVDYLDRIEQLEQQLAESARVQAALRAQIEKWQQRADRHAERATNAEDVHNFDRQDSAAYATRLCADDLAALLAGQERS